MKHRIAFLLAFSLLIFGFSGCKKVKEALQFDIGFTTKVYEFTLPAVPLGVSATVDVPVQINLDSILNANGVSLDKVKKIHLDKIELMQENATEENNLEVISHLAISMSSDAKPEFVEMARLDDNVLPMADPAKLIVPGNKDLNLKPYFQTQQFIYRISAGLREPTTEEKQCTVWTRYIVTVGG